MLIFNIYCHFIYLNLSFIVFCFAYFNSRCDHFSIKALGAYVCVSMAVVHVCVSMAVVHGSLEIFDSYL